MEPEPDPYLVLLDPDPDPGGQKMYVSCNTAEYALRGNLEKDSA